MARERATGILPVPAHIRDGHGTSTSHGRPAPFYRGARPRDFPLLADTPSHLLSAPASEGVTRAQRLPALAHTPPYRLSAVFTGYWRGFKITNFSNSPCLRALVVIRLADLFPASDVRALKGVSPKATAAPRVTHFPKSSIGCFFFEDEAIFWRPAMRRRRSGSSPARGATEED